MQLKQGAVQRAHSGAGIINPVDEDTFVGIKPAAVLTS